MQSRYAASMYMSLFHSVSSSSPTCLRSLSRYHETDRKISKASQDQRELIAHTTTRQGLTVTAFKDSHRYSTGILRLRRRPGHVERALFIGSRTLLFNHAQELLPF